MITPVFKVDQDNDSVTIVINTPYVRVRQSQFTDYKYLTVFQ